MAISAASSAALPQTPATAGATTNTAQTQGTGATSPFQALLAATSQTGQTTATTATTATSAANAIGLADATAGTADNTTDTTTGTATGAELSGLLALAQQALGLPANAAVAQATGQTTPATTTAEAQANDATRSRIDQLRLERAGGFISAQLGNRFLALPTLPQANPTSAQNATPATAPSVTTQTANPTANAPANTAIPVPVLAPNTAPTQTAAAAAGQGGTSSIPAQAPVVTNLIPTAPVPPDQSVTNPPVTEPAAPTPPAALPAAQLGDRPATTGDRFAAIAEAGAMLAPTTPTSPGSVVFANTLEQTLTITTVPGTLPAAIASPLPTVNAVLPGTSDGATVLPLVNIGTQATAAVVLPPLATDRTAETRPGEGKPDDTATSAPPGVVNPQAPQPAFESFLASAAPPASPATPAVQGADAVVAHAHVLGRDGATEFHMRLDPPNLGRVQIQLVTRGDEVHGQVLVASDAVRQMIESQLPELRQRLEAAGVNVQQFNVATDAGTNGGNQNAYRGSAIPEEFAPRTPLPSATSPPRARIGRVDTSSLDVTV